MLGRISLGRIRFILKTESGTVFIDKYLLDTGIINWVIKYCKKNFEFREILNPDVQTD